MTTHSDKLSHLRQNLAKLRDEANKLLKIFFEGDELLPGNVYELRRKCGKKTCRCVTHGKLHGTMVWSRREEGKSKLTVVPEDKLTSFQQLTDNYRRFRQSRSRLNEIQDQMLDLIDEIELARKGEPPT
jgi:hypothetical protein